MERVTLRFSSAAGLRGNRPPAQGGARCGGILRVAARTWRTGPCRPLPSSSSCCLPALTRAPEFKKVQKTNPVHCFHRSSLHDLPEPNHMYPNPTLPTSTPEIFTQASLHRVSSSRAGCFHDPHRHQWTPPFNTILFSRLQSSWFSSDSSTHRPRPQSRTVYSVPAHYQPKTLTIDDVPSSTHGGRMPLGYVASCRGLEGTSRFFDLKTWTQGGQDGHLKSLLFWRRLRTNLRKLWFRDPKTAMDRKMHERTSGTEILFRREVRTSPVFAREESFLRRRVALPFYRPSLMGGSQWSTAYNLWAVVQTF